MSNRYFLYDSAGDGFQTFPTAELRDAAAKAAIDGCLVDGGWLEDVFNITVGEITGTAVKTNIQQRPTHLDENGEDEEGNYWDADTEEKHDVEIRPLLPPRATVAALGLGDQGEERKCSRSSAVRGDSLTTPLGCRSFLLFRRPFGFT